MRLLLPFLVSCSGAAAFILQGDMGPPKAESPEYGGFGYFSFDASTTTPDPPPDKPAPSLAALLLAIVAMPELWIIWTTAVLLISGL